MCNESSAKKKPPEISLQLPYVALSDDGPSWQTVAVKYKTLSNSPEQYRMSVIHASRQVTLQVTQLHSYKARVPYPPAAHWRSPLQLAGPADFALCVRLCTAIHCNHTRFSVTSPELSKVQTFKAWIFLCQKLGQSPLHLGLCRAQTALLL